MPNNENWHGEWPFETAPTAGVVRPQIDLSPGSTGSPARKRHRANSSPASPLRPALVPTGNESALFAPRRSIISSQEKTNQQSDPYYQMLLPRPSFANLALDAGARRPNNLPTFGSTFPSNPSLPCFDNTRICNPLSLPMPPNFPQSRPPPQDLCIDPRLLQLSNANPQHPPDVMHSLQMSAATSDYPNQPSGSLPHVDHRAAVNQPPPLELVSNVAAPATERAMALYRTASPTNQPSGMMIPAGVGQPLPQHHIPGLAGGVVDRTPATQGRTFQGQSHPLPLPLNRPQTMHPPIALSNVNVPLGVRAALRYALAWAASALVDTPNGITADLAHKLWAVGGPRPPPDMLEPPARTMEDGGTGQEAGTRSRNVATDSQEDGHSDKHDAQASVEPPEQENNENGNGKEREDAKPGPNEADEEERGRLEKLCLSLLRQNRPRGMQQLHSLREQFSSNPILRGYIDYASQLFEQSVVDISNSHRIQRRSCEWVVGHWPDGTPKLCDTAVATRDLTKHLKNARHFPPPKGSSECKDDDVLCRWGGLNRRCKITEKVDASGCATHIKSMHMDIQDVVEGQPIVIPGITIEGVAFEVINVEVETSRFDQMRKRFVQKLKAVCLNLEAETAARPEEGEEAPVDMLDAGPKYPFERKDTPDKPDDYHSLFCGDGLDEERSGEGGEDRIWDDIFRGNNAFEHAGRDGEGEDAQLHLW